MKIKNKIELIIGDQEFFRVESIQEFGKELGRGWELKGTLSVSSGCLCCNGHQHFSFDELEVFIEDLMKLYSDLKGKARLGHVYELDYIELEADELGHIHIKGLIRPKPERQDQLDFTMMCDQTYLPQLIESVKRVLGELNKG